jgi:membrane protein required for colicin V production
MAWIDVAVSAIVLISALLGWLRGAAREILSFVSWIIALALAWWLHRDVAELLIAQVTQPVVRSAIAFAGLFFIGLILGTVGSAIVTALVHKTGLTRIDRILGVLFGAGRGLLLIGMVVFLAALTPIPSARWWQESNVINHIHAASQWLLAQVPTRVEAQVKPL